MENYDAGPEDIELEKHLVPVSYRVAWLLSYARKYLASSIAVSYLTVGFLWVLAVCTEALKYSHGIIPWDIDVYFRIGIQPVVDGALGFWLVPGAACIVMFYSRFYSVMRRSLFTDEGGWVGDRRKSFKDETPAQQACGAFIEGGLWAGMMMFISYYLFGPRNPFIWWHMPMAGGAAGVLVHLGVERVADAVNVARNGHISRPSNYLRRKRRFYTK